MFKSGRYHDNPKTWEERIETAVSIARGICTHATNCVNAKGNPRCAKCRVGKILVALDAFSKDHVTHAHAFKEVELHLKAQSANGNDGADNADCKKTKPSVSPVAMLEFNPPWLKKKPVKKQKKGAK